MKLHVAWFGSDGIIFTTERRFADSVERDFDIDEINLELFYELTGHYSAVLTESHRHPLYPALRAELTELLGPQSTHQPRDLHQIPGEPGEGRR